MSTEINDLNPDCLIESTRVFHVSREQLFRAWSDPTHLKKWWGPAGFTNTFNEFDFRVGGRWSLIMHGPDKGNYVNESEFTDIKVPALISWKRFTKPLFRVVVRFEDLSVEQSQLFFTMIFDSSEECRKVKVFAVDKNEENFDRLEIELSNMNFGKVR